MSFNPSGVQVYLAIEPVDMRKSINGLSLLVAHFSLDPFSGALFAFSNRSRTIVKILYWDRNGFCLWQKRLEEHAFKWPQSRDEVMQVEMAELSWLLAGLDPLQAHARLSYSMIS